MYPCCCGIFNRNRLRETAGILGDKETIIVLPTRAPSAKRDAFETMATQLNRTGKGIVKDDTTVTVRDLKEHSLLVLGCEEENMLLSVMPLPSGMVYRVDDCNNCT